MNPILQTITFHARGILTAALITITLFGCGPSDEEIADGGDPLAALRVSALSVRYDGRFWQAQHAQSPTRFAEAIAYCTSESEAGRLGERPNCEPVMMAAEFIRNVERERRSPRLEGRGYTGMLGQDILEEGTAGAPSEGGDAEEER
jgi:hypothetical protein